MVQFGRMNLTKRTELASFCFNCGDHATRIVTRGPIVQDCCDRADCELEVERLASDLLRQRVEPQAGC